MGGRDWPAVVGPGPSRRERRPWRREERGGWQTALRGWSWQEFNIDVSIVVIGGRALLRRRGPAPVVRGAGNGWGMRVWGGRGPVQEVAAEAAIVEVRLALLGGEARGKAGCVAGSGRDSRRLRGGPAGANLDVLLSRVAVQRVGLRMWVPDARWTARRMRKCPALLRPCLRATCGSWRLARGRYRPGEHVCEFDL